MMMSESFYTSRKKIFAFLFFTISNSNFVYALCFIKTVADYSRNM